MLKVYTRTELFEAVKNHYKYFGKMKVGNMGAMRLKHCDLCDSTEKFFSATKRYVSGFFVRHVFFKKDRKTDIALNVEEHYCNSVNMYND